MQADSDARTRRTTRAWLAACAVLIALPAGAAAATLPTVQTLPTDKTLLSDTYALLSGIVNPQGFNTVYRFQYGRTTAYGKTTPITSAGNGKADVPVDVSLDDLKPNTTYHYRLVVSPVKSSGDFTYLGDFFGGDQSFKTARALAVSIVSGKRSKRIVKVKLKAVGPVDEVAKGKLTLKAKVGRRLRRIGSARYSITAGKTKTIAVKVSRATRKVVASAKTSGVKKAVTKTLNLGGK